MDAIRVRLRALHSSRFELILASMAINILSLALPVAVLQVYDRIIPYRSEATLAYIGIALLGVVILDYQLSAARTHLSGWTAARIQHRLNTELVGHMFQSELRAYEQTPPGVYLSRLRAIDALKNIHAGQGLLLVVDLPFAAVFLLLIALIGGKLVIVPAVMIVGLALAAQYGSRQQEQAMERRKEADHRRYNFMFEVLRKVYTIKAVGAESLMTRRYERLQEGSAAASREAVETGTWVRSTGQLLSQLTNIGIAAFGAVLAIEHQLTIGGLAACVLLSGRASQPLVRALSTVTQLRNGQVAERQVQEILSLPLEARPGAPPFRMKDGSIALRDVSFSYGPGDRPIFESANVSVAAGETVAIMGANGSGKSTLVTLMMGLLSPNSGAIEIDGMDIRNFDLASLRRQIIHLPQKPVLFRGTILDNLTMFRGDDHVEAAMQMAERLGLHEVVGRMPLGYETPIEHAANDGLPGGVRQRIALVRALTLVESPRLILFDEANTFLDQRGDQLLLDVLAEYRGKATMVVVSHRPSYLRLGHSAKLIRDGRLVEAPLTPRPAVRTVELVSA